MIESGEARKYILYAVGEISLVVIGILIALQVNNWNTQSQNKKKLVSYLQSIEANIGDDIKQLQTLQISLDSMHIQSYQAMMILEKSTFTFDEAMRLYNSLVKAFELEEFNCNKHGFESFKISGLLDLIQGTDLERLLFDYYKMTDLIAHKEIRWNTYTQEMQVDIMKSEYTPQWVKNNMRVYNNPALLTDPVIGKQVQAVLKGFFSRPAIYALYTKTMGDTELGGIYNETIEIGQQILSEIHTQKSHND